MYPVRLSGFPPVRLLALLNHQRQFRSSQDSYSCSNDSSTHGGAICPRTLGLKERVHFIDNGSGSDWIGMSGTPGSSFRNPSFVDTDQNCECVETKSTALRVISDQG